jgi:hypothetical protein
LDGLIAVLVRLSKLINKKRTWLVACLVACYLSFRPVVRPGVLDTHPGLKAFTGLRFCDQGLNPFTVNVLYSPDMPTEHGRVQEKAVIVSGRVACRAGATKRAIMLCIRGDGVLLLASVAEATV